MQIMARRAYTLYHQSREVQSSDSKSTLQRRMKRELAAAQRARTELPTLYYAHDMSAAIDWGNSGRSLKTWEIRVNGDDE